MLNSVVQTFLAQSFGYIILVASLIYSLPLLLGLKSRSFMGACGKGFSWPRMEVSSCI